MTIGASGFSSKRIGLLGLRILTPVVESKLIGRGWSGGIINILFLGEVRLLV